MVRLYIFPRELFSGPFLGFERYRKDIAGLRAGIYMKFPQVRELFRYLSISFGIVSCAFIRPKNVPKVQINNDN